MTKKKKAENWSTMTNDRRGRPMITVTLSPEGIEELDRQRGKAARGAYIEVLLEKNK